MARLLPSLIVVLALMSGDALSAGSAAGQPSPLPGQPTSRGRPLIVLVHGRAHGAREQANVVREWQSGLDEGLNNAGFSGLISRDDVHFIWYGDLYRPGSRSYAADPGCSGREDSQVPADVSDRGIERRGIANSEHIRRQAIATAVGGVRRSTAIRVIRDTYDFFSDLVRRCTTTRRLLVVLDDAKRAGRPVVLVTHSMGGLVAYDALRNRAGSDAYPVSRWITLGTQLGLPYVMQQFDGISTRRLAPVPPSVTSWINIKNEGDLLAFTMRPFFCLVNDGACATTRGSRVRPVEMRITATFGRQRGIREPHWIGNYLRHRTTATAVATAWCGAFSPADRPASCGAVQSIDLYAIPDEW